MKLDEAHTSKLTYYIVEDITDAAIRLQHEMQQFADWQFAGHAKAVKQAKHDIGEKKPQLIFCDWDIIGGSGFEVLQFIKSIIHYHPFIIFNTGFQSDHPDIAEELINTYKPDAFINKPYWQKLKEQLETLLNRAKIKSIEQNKEQNSIWINDERGRKIPICPQHIICILQSEINPRSKIFYTLLFQKGIELIITWKEINLILSEHHINFFITNKRSSVVIKNSIESYYSPFVYLKQLSIKVEIVTEYIKDFEMWLHQ